MSTASASGRSARFGLTAEPSVVTRVSEGESGGEGDHPCSRGCCASGALWAGLVDLHAWSIVVWVVCTLRLVTKLLIASVMGVRNAGMVAGPLASLGTSSALVKSPIAAWE